VRRASRSPPRRPASSAAATRCSSAASRSIIPAAIILGFFLGKLLDYWLHTHWLYLVGLVFGAVVGFVQMIRMATASLKDK